MTPTEIEAILREAFGKCETVGYPLEAVQKQILLRSLMDWVEQLRKPVEAEWASCVMAPPTSDRANPLDDLLPQQRRVLLRFIQAQNRENRSWKAQLLNDWLNSRSSGELQFIRQQYGLQWLEQVLPAHIVQYADEVPLLLQVGDRIEVANSLWEWVQEEGPCSQEWFACRVIGISNPSEGEGERLPDRCIIRLDSGMEYEIQGVYEWNRYNWRWIPERSDA